MDESRRTVAGGSTAQSQHIISVDGVAQPYVWSSPEGGRKIPIGKQIFCNRSLNMKNTMAVGFDMDYTLAQYKSETFESLAYEGTVKKLVNDLGYPKEVCLSWDFSSLFCFHRILVDNDVYV